MRRPYTRGETFVLIARLFAASVRSQMQYRTSFILQSVFAFAITGVEFLGIAALFSRFGTLPGWSLHEVAFLYGLVNSAFALADMSSRGFDVFSDLLRSGDFDTVLLRPRSAALQVAARELRLRTLGRLAQGAAVLAWGASHVAWSPERAALAAAALASGMALFYGLIILQATMAFWTMDSLELMNSLTYGGVYAGGYPLDIFPRWFRGMFTYFVPLACATWFPVLRILGRDVPAATAWLAPLAGPAFLAAALGAWRIGVRKYASSGS